VNYGFLFTAYGSGGLLCLVAALLTLALRAPRRRALFRANDVEIGRPPAT
jgi:hypothetical protein